VSCSELCDNFVNISLGGIDYKKALTPGKIIKFSKINKIKIFITYFYPNKNRPNLLFKYFERNSYLINELEKVRLNIN
jgi:hypothetical protein